MGDGDTTHRRNKTEKGKARKGKATTRRNKWRGKGNIEKEKGEGSKQSGSHYWQQAPILT